MARKFAPRRDHSSLFDTNISDDGSLDWISDVVPAVLACLPPADGAVRRRRAVVVRRPVPDNEALVSNHRQLLRLRRVWQLTAEHLIHYC